MTRQVLPCEEEVTPSLEVAPVTVKRVTTKELLTTGARPEIILMLVCSCIFMAVLNTNMFNVALPSIGREFAVSDARLGWIVTSYSLVFGMAVSFYGRLGDLYGLRRLFMLGLALFTLGSIACFLAPNFWLLILARVVQASGNAAIPSLGTAAVIRAFPPERRGFATGYTAAVVGVGYALGPSLGGIVTQFASWRGLYLISALLGIGIPFASRILPRDERRGVGSVDLPGGLTLALMIGFLLVGVTSLRSNGPLEYSVLGPIGLSLLLLFALIWRMRSYAHPFVDPALLRNRNYVLLGGVAFTVMIANMGSLVLTPLLLDRVNHLPAGKIGLAMLPPAILMGLFAPIGGRLADRIGSLAPLRLGIALIIIGFALQTSFGAGQSAVVVSAFLMLIGAGLGFANSTMNSSVSLVLPSERVGLGIGLFNMLFFVGGGFGAAITTVVLESRADALSSWNPLHSGAGANFSDAFLVTLIAVAIAFTLSWLVRIPHPRKN